MPAFAGRTSVAPRFRWECLTNRTVNWFPAPATSHGACGFPALRAPAHFTSGLSDWTSWYASGARNRPRGISDRYWNRHALLQLRAYRGRMSTSRSRRDWEESSRAIGSSLLAGGQVRIDGLGSCRYFWMARNPGAIRTEHVYDMATIRSCGFFPATPQSAN
jgi:hypothetical protein